MGGIVTTNLNENESSFGVSSRRESMSALSSKVSSRRVRKHNIQAMTKHLNDFPLLSYEELDELYLPLCAASWEHVATTKADDGTNLLLEEMFQLNAFQGMRTLKNKTDAQFIESALTQQATGRNKMTTNPMSFTMKFCVRIHQANNKRRQQDSNIDTIELGLKKKLTSLGRAHAKAGVTPDHLRVFCEVLLTSFAGCFYSEDAEVVHNVMFAWTANMKYMVANMSNTRFSIMQAIALNTSTDSAENHSKQLLQYKCSRCGKTISSNGSGNTVTSTNSGSISIGHCATCSQVSTPLMNHSYNAPSGVSHNSNVSSEDRTRAIGNRTPNAPVLVSSEVCGGGSMNDSDDVDCHGCRTITEGPSKRENGEESSTVYRISPIVTQSLILSAAVSNGQPTEEFPTKFRLESGTNCDASSIDTGNYTSST
jgi:hypothetical protein